jgi:hypothetical protein
MSFGGSATDDYFVSSGASNTTSDLSALFEVGFAASGSNGSIGSTGSITYNNGISQNDPFAIVWFSTNTATAGSRYGFLNLGQLMPADNLAGVDMSSPFAGSDPIRSASNTFGVIPEPSRMMLLGFGLVGLFFRRRR